MILTGKINDAEFFFLPRSLADHGNTAARAKTTTRRFRCWNETRFHWETDTGNFGSGAFSAVTRAQLSVNKSALCKCRNSVIILFGRAPWYSLLSRSDKYFRELRRSRCDKSTGLLFPWKWYDVRVHARVYVRMRVWLCRNASEIKKMKDCVGRSILSCFLRTVDVRIRGHILCISGGSSVNSNFSSNVSRYFFCSGKRFSDPRKGWRDASAKDKMQSKSFLRKSNESISFFFRNLNYDANDSP